MEKLCLIQLLQLYTASPLECANDLVVYHLYINRKNLSPRVLREYLEKFIMVGFNPFRSTLSPSSKVMMKSIIAKCDSIIK